MKERNLKVAYEDVAALVPYAKNARRHTDDQVDMVANSIREFGFNDPIGVWTNADGESEIVEGHGRVLAAQKLGLERVPVIHLDGLSDEQRRAYALAHNRLGEISGWDSIALEEELSDLGDQLDMSDFGFIGATEKEIEAAIQEAASAASDDTDLKAAKPKTVTCPKCGHEFELLA